MKEDLTAEEAFESKKRKLAELGQTLLADPESNIKSLKEMLEMKVPKDVKKMRYYETTLLSAYKV